MKVTEATKKDRSIVEVVIEVDETEFEQAISSAYQKAKNSISLPGFRKGKVPRKVAEARFGQGAFYEDAINEIWPDAVQFAVDQESLQMVGQPDVNVREVSKEGLVIEAQIPVYPEVRLRKYKGAVATKPHVEVTSSDLDEEMENLRKQAGWLEPADRAVENGDTAVIDFEGFENGVPFEGGKGEGFDLEIGSGSFVPGFEEQLIGMKAGEEKDIDITFPMQYHEGLAGKDVVFHVKVNEVKVKKLPDMDDEFAKDISEFETLEALREDLQKKILEKRENIARQARENQVLRYVVDYMDADIPDAMIEAQLDRTVEDFARQVTAAQGMSFNQYLEATGKTIEELRNDTRGGALYRVQVNIALREVIKLENIEAEEEDFDKEIKRLMAEYNMTEDRVRSLLPVDEVMEDLKIRKAIEFLLEHSVEKGTENAEVNEEIVVTEADREPEHHHHDDEEAQAAEQKEEKPEEKPAKKPAKPRATKAKVAEPKAAEKDAAGETEEKPEKKPRKRTTKKATPPEGDVAATEEPKAE